MTLNPDGGRTLLRIDARGHLETIIPALFRRVGLRGAQMFRIDTPDGDFLDMDYYRSDCAPALVVLCHGLEGNSRKPYILGMAEAFLRIGWSVLAWNYRGCSGTLNIRPVLYHSGASTDLDTVISHALKMGYERIGLIGFSLGGNLLLKYLGEKRWGSAECVFGAVAISVPLDLESSCRKISSGFNKIYEYRFLRSLENKRKLKAAQFPMENILHGPAARSLYEFDDRYTAPLHGFSDATDYYSRCSALNYLEGIRTKTLVMNAINDPLLTDSCFPGREEPRSPAVELEFPAAGGHVGFASPGKNGHYRSEVRATGFLQHALEAKLKPL